MRVIHRIVAVATIALALTVGYLSIAHPVSASAVHTKQAQIVAQVVVPLVGGGNFDVSTTGAHVTGHLDFTGSQSFQLTNVVLSDTKCDGSSAFFQAVDQFSSYAVHQNGSGCGSSISFGTLNGSANYHINFIFIKVWSNCCTSSSPAFNNPL